LAGPSATSRPAVVAFAAVDLESRSSRWTVKNLTVRYFFGSVNNT
jgi:hypothetical protein